MRPNKSLFKIIRTYDDFYGKREVKMPSSKYSGEITIKI